MDMTAAFNVEGLRCEYFVKLSRTKVKLGSLVYFTFG
jgi:hypothetical protein